MKPFYSSPLIEIITFAPEDIITASNGLSSITVVKDMPGAIAGAMDEPSGEIAAEPALDEPTLDDY